MGFNSAFKGWLVIQFTEVIRPNTDGWISGNLQCCHRRVFGGARAAKCRPNTFRRFRKILEKWLLTLSCLSVRPWEWQFGSQWNDSFQIWYSNILGKSVKKIQVSLNLIRISGTLHGDPSTFMIKSCSVLLRKKNVSDKTVVKIKTHILCSVTFFPSKMVPFMR